MFNIGEELYNWHRLYHVTLKFQGLMHLQGKPVCSFDPEGLIFAAGINSEMVKLYDLRSFDKVRGINSLETFFFCFVFYWGEKYWVVTYRPQGPFATFKLQYDRTCEWTGLKFSNDGKLILLSTNGGALRILDAFKGAVLHSFGVRDKLLQHKKLLDKIKLKCLNMKNKNQSSKMDSTCITEYTVHVHSGLQQQ